MEEIKILSDSGIPQVEMSSCGSNNGPLRRHGEYPAYIACNLFCKDDAIYTRTVDGREISKRLHRMAGTVTKKLGI